MTTTLQEQLQQRTDADTKAALKAYTSLLNKSIGGKALTKPEADKLHGLCQQLGITPEQAEEDSRLYLDVITATADRDAAAAEAERLGPKGELSFGQELDNLDAGLARDTNALLEPKRVLLARIERFDAAAEVLKAKESRLAHARTQVPRLCG